MLRAMLGCESHALLSFHFTLPIQRDEIILTTCSNSHTILNQFDFTLPGSSLCILTDAGARAEEADTEQPCSVFGIALCFDRTIAWLGLKGP